MFFTGMHHPSDAAKVPAAFISAHAIAKRKSGFPVRRWVLDSGAFRTIELHGGYPDPVEVYADLIRRYSDNGCLLAAVAQDFMCEPFMLERTGLTIADHQRLTIERYDALLACDVGGVYIMPVLQGYAPADYVDHIRQYGDRLGPRAWVGVGSLCKRNANPAAILAVLLAIKSERPDLRLHGFGIKIIALGWQLIRDLLFSADSMAWSLAARFEGRDGNDAGEAARYARRVATMPTQLSFGRWWYEAARRERPMTDIERAVRAMVAVYDQHAVGRGAEIVPADYEAARAVIESVLLEPSEEVRNAARHAVARVMARPPFLRVNKGSPLPYEIGYPDENDEGVVTDAFADHLAACARRDSLEAALCADAALRAAALAVLGRDGGAG